MNKKTFLLAGAVAAFALFAAALPAADTKDYPGTALEPSGNPIFTDAWTCDPAPLVVGDRLFVYTGEDIYKDGEQNGLPGNYNIAAWRCYSTTDMVHWTSHGVLLKPEQFPNGRAGVAWAAQVVEKGGKFYWYVTYGNKNGQGNSIGVAIADSPIGPFKPVEKPVITDDMTTGNDIDPTVLIDDDGTAWLAWGQTSYLAKLKDNMCEIDGEIINLGLQSYIEGPWLYKRKGLYYNIYAGFGGMGGFGGGFGGGNRPAGAGGPGAGGNRPAGAGGPGAGGNRPAGAGGAGAGGAPAGGMGGFGGFGGFGGGAPGAGAGGAPAGGMGGFGGFGGGAPGAGANRPAGGANGAAAAGGAPGNLPGGAPGAGGAPAGGMGGFGGGMGGFGGFGGGAPGAGAGGAPAGGMGFGGGAPGAGGAPAGGMGGFGGGMGGFGGFGGGAPGAGAGGAPAGGMGFGGFGGGAPGAGGAPAGGMGGFGGGMMGGFGGGAPGAGAGAAPAGGPGAGGNRPAGAGGPGAGGNRPAGAGGPGAGGNRPAGAGGNRPNRPAGGGGGGFGECINYSTAEKITGPWTFRGQVTGSAENSFTIHPGVVDFKGHTYLFYHNGKLDRDGQTGQSLRRSVCVDELFFNEDGTIKAVTQTKDAIKEPLK